MSVERGELNGVDALFQTEQMAWDGKPSYSLGAWTARSTNSLLGGLWFPPEFVPDWMRTIQPFSYTTWAMRGMNDLVLRDRGLDAISGSLTVLFLYGLVTMIIGVRLFRARHSAR